MVRPACIVLLAALATAAASSTSTAAGWESPSLLARMTAVTDSELFPGSTVSGPDESVELDLEVETSRRLGRALKLGLQLEASASKYQRFDAADFGRLALGSSFRRGGSTLTLAGEWTPRRLKFPGTADEGGVFARSELRVGLRRTVGQALRLRAEGRLRRDDYRAPFDSRDSDARELYGQIALRLRSGWSLRTEAAVSHASASSRKYSQDEQWALLGATWSGAAWKADAAIVSGVSRYPEARLGDSNHRRRDQSLETRLQLSRALGAGWSALLGAQRYEQISTRAERTYDTHEFRLGLEWRRAGE